MAIAPPGGFILCMRTFLVGVYGDPSGSAALAFTQRLAGSSARVVAAGADVRALAELAEVETADLIAVGEVHGAEALLRSSPCPVLFVPQDYADREIRSIGVAYDARPESRRALFVAEELAKALDVALVVMRVAAPAESVHAEAGLRHTAARSRARGLRAGAQLLVGAPGPALAAAAAHVDLLVMGSQGHGRLRSALLGSVSRELIEDGCCPVLLTTRTTLAMPVRPLLTTTKADSR